MSRPRSRIEALWAIRLGEIGSSLVAATVVAVSG